MKLSISLAAEDLEVLDAYAQQAGLKSRSAAVQHAIRLLRLPDLEEDYEVAWAEWAAAGEQDAWSVTVTDGSRDAAR